MVESLIEWRLIAYIYRINSTYSLLDDVHKNEPFSVIEFSIILTRNTPKFFVVIIIPAFCLCLLSTFGLLIPTQSGEKLGYSVTILLSFFVYKEAVVGMVTPWERYDETPTLIGMFTGITISTVTFTSPESLNF